jgi:predicted ATPase
VDSGIDYRLRVLTHVELYHSPIRCSSSTNLATAVLNELAQGKHIYHEVLWLMRVM